MTVSVAHLPSSHPYVDHLRPDGHDDAVAIVDVDVFDVDALEGRVDVVHVHFGFEHLDRRQLAAWCRELRRGRIGLVYTAHDLDNPHLVDQRAHHAAVAELARAADLVVTLTPWAARELRRRTDTASVVVPHPHVVPAEALRRPSAEPRHGVYVHAATLRPNLDLDLLERVAGPAARLDGARIHVRRSHLDAAPPAVRRQLRRLAAHDGVTLDIGPRLDDDELWTRIGSSRVLLLPYRWGSHSGLLEAARDLGTPVVAPARGGFGDQGATTYDGAASCRRALAAATAPVPTPDRAVERQYIASTHLWWYHRVAGRVGRAA